MGIVLGVLAIYVWIKWIVPAFDYEGDSVFLMLFRAFLSNPIALGLVIAAAIVAGYLTFS